MNETSGHDPLCGCALREHSCENSWAGTSCTKCQCHKIARVRTDEQARALVRHIIKMKESDEEHDKLLDALEDVVNQACSVSDDEEGGSHLDSMALSAYAHGLKALAEHGRVVIEHEVGRRVIGRWASNG